MKKNSGSGLIVFGVLMLLVGAQANSVMFIFAGSFAVVCGIVVTVKQRMETRKLKKALGEK